jgi:thioredoxin 1
MFAPFKSIYMVFLLPPIFFSIYSSARVVDVLNKNQFNEVIKKTGPTIVEFSASWCGVCQAVKRPFEQIALEPEFKNVTFARVDVDQHPNLSKENNIMGVPTFVYLENGNKVNQEIGVINTDSFDKSLRSNLRNNFKIAQAEADVPVPISAQLPQEQVEIDETTIMPTETVPAADDTEAMAPTMPTESTEAPTLIQPTQEEQVAIVMTEEPAEQAGGILANVQNFIMGIINGVIAFITSIFDSIKKLFGY